MELLSMIMHARVQDLEGTEIAGVTAVTFSGGKMILTVDILTDLDEFEDDDPDGGEEVPVDDKKVVHEPDAPPLLRMVGNDG